MIFLLSSCIFLGLCLPGPVPASPDPPSSQPPASLSIHPLTYTPNKIHKSKKYIKLKIKIKKMKKIRKI